MNKKNRFFCDNSLIKEFLENDIAVSKVHSAPVQVQYVKNTNGIYSTLNLLSPVFVPFPVVVDLVKIYGTLCLF